MFATSFTALKFPLSRSGQGDLHVITLVSGLKVAAMTACIFMSWCFFIMMSELIVSRIDLCLRLGFNPLDLPPDVASYGVWDIVVYLPYSMKKGAAYFWKLALLLSLLISALYLLCGRINQRGPWFHVLVGVVCGILMASASLVFLFPSIRADLGSRLWMYALPNLLSMLPVGIISKLLVSLEFRELLVRSLQR